MRQKDKEKTGQMARWLVCVLSAILVLWGCTGAARRQMPTLPSGETVDRSVSASTARSASAERRSEKEMPSQTESLPEQQEKAFTVVIDAGHQAKANLEPEPIGPGSTQTKYKVAGGTTGATSGTPEYEVNLLLALLLESELTERGYQVVMTRTDNEVDISNAQRAEIANQLDADAFLRIHCNGSTDPDAAGMMTLCQTAENPFQAQQYLRCRLLADCILSGMMEQTGCTSGYVWETDTMAGLNWSSVPVTLLEVGYLTNPAEEALLLDRNYQKQLVGGIIAGLEEYQRQTAEESFRKQ